MVPPLDEPEWIQQDRPSAARIYDYLLGGHHNFAVDRVAGDRLLAINPDAPLAMWANRAFLRRAIAFLSDLGIEQFLDIGSGIPTVGNVHEIAERTNPRAHVVYVDIDAVAIRQSLAMLKKHPGVTAIRADARKPDTILAHPAVQRLLDFKRPVAVLLVALLHFVTDDGEAHDVVRVLREALAPGSYLVLSHASAQGVPDEVVERGKRLYAGTTNPITSRSRIQIQRFFEGLELVEPGLVHPPQWHPEGPHDPLVDEPRRSGALAAVARKV